MNEIVQRLAVPTFTEYAAQLVTGVEVDVLDELALGRGRARGVEFLDVRPIVVEGLVGSRTHNYAGRLDLIADTRLGRAIVDLKTSRRGVYPRTALQNAGYLGCEFLVDADGAEVRCPRGSSTHTGCR